MHLLDVNLLIALCDADHAHHDRTRAWFRRTSISGWATCPLTENALLRIMGHPDYPGGPGSPADILPLLQTMRAMPNHVFLPDTVSLADANLFLDLADKTPKMLTDVYLLGLAVTHGAYLATLDKRIDPGCVQGGHHALTLVR
jgi:toxin-antitoxin system PIN domain toxin